jgi:triosephosphate isomerase
MIIAANFKTNHSRVSTSLYIQELNSFIEREEISDEVIVFPTFTSLDRFEGDTIIGVQNGYPTVNGSFTGEIGLEQINEFDVKTILIGHSERRHILGESSEAIIAKFEYYKRNGFKIVYCVGEPLEVREAGEESVREYVMEQFEGIDTNYENLIVAYEPVWAIGTGKVATVEEIGSIHQSIKSVIDKPLLYGGSVKPNNIGEILQVEGVDGALIGTASWDINSFKEILSISKSL